MGVMIVGVTRPADPDTDESILPFAQLLLPEIESWQGVIPLSCHY